jgi:hypothetical protein
MTQKARCIQEYADEDSVIEFEEGIIDEHEIVWNRIGDTSPVVVEYYDKNYWELIKED